MQHKAYSVVIPAYNATRTLAETLESLLGQTEPPAKIIVADDASTDGTALLAQSFGVEVRTFEHSGLSGVQNRALELVATPLVAFVDSDDVWGPDTGRALAAQFVRQELHAANVGARWFWDGEEAPPPLGRCSPDVHWFRVTRSDLLRENPLPKSGTMFATNAVRAVGGYDERLTSCEDLDLALKLVEAGGEIVRTEWQGIAYRQSMLSMSRDPRRMILNESRVVLTRLGQEHGAASSQVRRMTRVFWIRHAARLAAAQQPLSRLPKLSELQSAPTPLDVLLERVVRGRLQSHVAASWRLLVSAREKMAPGARFT